jgi:hypothetical protein
MVVYLFHLVVFSVDSKGRLAAHNAQWSFDTVKHCAHLSGLVCSSIDLNVSPTDMNTSSSINM